MEKNIAVMKGDGIGPEVVNEAIKVLNVIAAKYGHSFHYHEMLTGCAALDVYDTALRDEDFEAACKADALLFGSIGDPARWSYTGANGTKVFKSRAESDGKAIQVFRKKCNLYCNVRPMKIYPSLVGSSPLKDRLAQGVDLIILRENTGGSYFGKKFIGEKDGVMQASDDCTYAWEQIEPIARAGFEMAMSRRKKLTLVHKWNVMDTGVLWQKVFNEVAKEYPEVEYDQVLSDNCAQQLVKNPAQFDIIATDNLFGDVLSDLASAVGGSVGMAASAGIGAGPWGMYECAGGSAPKRAGQNIVNPIGEILCAAMMLRLSLGMPEEADAVEKAVERALDAGYRTYDIMTDGCTKVSCSGMGDAIASLI